MENRGNRIILLKVLSAKKDVCTQVDTNISTAQSTESHVSTTKLDDLEELLDPNATVSCQIYTVIQILLYKSIIVQPYQFIFMTCPMSATNPTLFQFIHDYLYHHSNLKDKIFEINLGPTIEAIQLLEKSVESYEENIRNSVQTDRPIAELLTQIKPKKNKKLNKQFSRNCNGNTSLVLYSYFEKIIAFLRTQDILQLTNYEKQLFSNALDNSYKKWQKKKIVVDMKLKMSCADLIINIFALARMCIFF